MCVLFTRFKIRVNLYRLLVDGAGRFVMFEFDDTVNCGEDSSDYLLICNLQPSRFFQASPFDPLDLLDSILFPSLRGHLVLLLFFFFFFFLLIFKISGLLVL